MNVITGAQMVEGYVVQSVLSDRDVALLLRAFGSLEPHPRAQFHSTLLHAEAAHRAAVDTVLRAILVPRLAALLPGWRLVVCSFAAKSPHSGGELPLHQDWTFVDERQHPSLGIWCPLVDVDESNGCLQVLPGSQRLALDPRVALGPALHPELVREGRQRLRPIPMQAGQVMIFDQRLFHASGANGSSVARVAAAAVAVPRDAPLRHYHLRRGPVRGRATDGSEAVEAEVFEVDDAFFVSHPWGTRPSTYPSLGVVRLRPGRCQWLQAGDDEEELLEQQRVRPR